jgi:hypothetical protein
MLKERFEDTAQRVPHTCVAAQRRGVVTCLSRGTGVQAAAIFDVRALLTPPLAAERMIRLSSNGCSCRNACLTENAPT